MEYWLLIWECLHRIRENMGMCKPCRQCADVADRQVMVDDVTKMSCTKQMYKSIAQFNHMG